MEDTVYDIEGLMKKLADRDLTAKFPAPLEGEPDFICKGIVDLSQINSIMEEVEIKTKDRIPATSDISDGTLEAAVWLYHGVVSPKLTFDIALDICKKTGFWSTGITSLIKKLSGATPAVLDSISSNFQGK